MGEGSPAPPHFDAYASGSESHLEGLKYPFNAFVSFI